MTKLSVNVNKVAVLRNSRGGSEPCVVKAAETAIAAGAHGITVHPRPDQRHIRPDDVFALASLVKDRCEYNLEGNPFAPARAGYPGFMALVQAVRPTQATLVPDGDGQITSDHGFNLQRDGDRLRPYIQQLRDWGVRVSLFMDADAVDIEQASALGANRIELYTGPFAHAFQTGSADSAVSLCRQATERAQAVGLQVNAGHDLSQANLGVFLQGVPDVAEVSIGHALFSEALYQGLDSTVRAYLAVIAASR